MTLDVAEHPSRSAKRVEVIGRILRKNIALLCVLPHALDGQHLACRGLHSERFPDIVASVEHACANNKMWHQQTGHVQRDKLPSEFDHEFFDDGLAIVTYFRP